MKLRFVFLAAALLVPAVLVGGCGSDGTDGGTQPDTTPPLAPVILGARATDGTTGIWWSPNNEPDLNGYHVYVSQYGVIRRMTKVPVSGTNHSVQLQPTGSATVFVTAIDYSGNESSPSASRTVNLSEAPVIDGYTGGDRVLDQGL